MSQSLAHVIKTWEDVALDLQRKVASHKGNPLTERDNRTFAVAIAMCGCHLVDLRNRHGLIESDRELIAWAHNVHSMDVLDLGSFLSDAVTVIRNVYEPVSFNWFKHQLARYPFTGKFLAPTRRMFQSFLEHPSPEGFYLCNQALSFLTRLSLSDITLDLETEYENLETSLLSYSPPSDLLEHLRIICEEWMGAFAPSPHMMPRHGPGAVAELPRRANIAQKYQSLSTDTLLTYVMQKHTGISVQSYSPYPLGDLSRECKIVFVPKSMKTKRIISKEPAALQFWQQALRSEMYGYIHNHHYLSKHIAFSKQEYNGALALEGSRTGQFCTIDLSSASDRVTSEIVRALFGRTRAYPFLVATRSRTALLPSGKKVRLQKFAPMGSALCFPIQTLVFACAVEYAIRRARSTFLGNFPTWRVYGDDIIVADPLFEDLVMILEALGLVVNTSKSFHSPTRFRESCGSEGYDGVNVSPLRISRNFSVPRGGITHSHSSIYEGMISFANSAYEYHLPILRAFVMRMIFANSVGIPFFSTDGNGALKSDYTDNYRADRRFNRDLFRSEVKVVRVVTKHKGCEGYGDDTGYLFETLRQSFNRTGDMFLPEHRIIVPRGTVVSRLREQWTPTRGLSQ